MVALVEKGKREEGGERRGGGGREGERKEVGRELKGRKEKADSNSLQLVIHVKIHTHSMVMSSACTLD